MRNKIAFLFGMLLREGKHWSHFYDWNMVGINWNSMSQLNVPGNKILHQSYSFDPVSMMEFHKILGSVKATAGCALDPCKHARITLMSPSCPSLINHWLRAPFLGPQRGSYSSITLKKTTEEWSYLLLSAKQKCSRSNFLWRDQNCSTIKQSRKVLL